MNIIWSPEAENDRTTIFDYVAASNPAAAIRLDEEFSRAVLRLKAQPELGRRGRIAGTRELLPHEHYRLVYEAHDETIRILALVHTSRLWPPVK